MSKKPLPTRVIINKDRSDSLATLPPQARGSINDFVQLFTDDEVKVLDFLVSAFEKTTTIGIIIATVNSMMIIYKEI